jgi:hypothetical protein
MRASEHAAAAQDFAAALASMRDSLVIDYRQLGFRFGWRKLLGAGWLLLFWLSDFFCVFF